MAIMAQINKKEKLEKCTCSLQQYSQPHFYIDADGKEQCYMETSPYNMPKTRNVGGTDYEVFINGQWFKRKAVDK
jgi:hypothetical protein